MKSTSRPKSLLLKKETIVSLSELARVGGGECETFTTWTRFCTTRYAPCELSRDIICHLK
jgi:hypothetical protein